MDSEKPKYGPLPEARREYPGMEPDREYDDAQYIDFNLGDGDTTESTRDPMPEKSIENQIEDLPAGKVELIRQRIDSDQTTKLAYEKARTIIKGRKTGNVTGLNRKELILETYNLLSSGGNNEKRLAREMIDTEFKLDLRNRGVAQLVTQAFNAFPTIQDDYNNNASMKQEEGDQPNITVVIRNLQKRGDFESEKSLDTIQRYVNERIEDLAFKMKVTPDNVQIIRPLIDIPGNELLKLKYEAFKRASLVEQGKTEGDVNQIKALNTLIKDLRAEGGNEETLRNLVLSILSA